MVRPPPMVNASRHALMLGAAALLALAGCSWLPAAPPIPRVGEIFASPSQVRGHMVTAEQLDQVTPGVSTRDDVQAALGSPTTTATFDDNEWYYIGAISRPRPARTMGIEDQQVVVVTFNPQGTVAGIRRLGAEDGRQVRVVQRETPSPGSERSFMQQLFGNVGRLGPGLSGQQSTQGPGTQSPR
ncbi:outer membrane protein assembly factor BamE [Falsiroseomonas sp. HW251]|uniref:outer membrane protein assembly factor BamE n=1 Tax=Falsiroseomonas sp. HW251 TaxID=3390998 RepID=UPI003D318CCA